MPAAPAPGHGQHTHAPGLSCRYFFMDCQVVTVTPEMANDILLRNTRNRPIIQSRVLEFEAQLLRGEMQLTHQGIAISETNVLLDGQHRLMAIANTGIPAAMLLSYGLPDSVFAVLDTGAKRRPGDVLSMEGAKNASTAAAGIKLYILYNEAPKLVWTGKIPIQIVSTSRIDDEYNSDKETWTWASTAASQSHAKKICTPGPMCCLLYLAHMHHRYSRAFLEAFSMQIKIGDNLQPGNPILAYRNKMISTTYNSAQSRLADYVKLFNAYATAQQLKIFKSQQYPPMPSLIDAAESIHDGALA